MSASRLAPGPTGLNRELRAGYLRLVEERFGLRLTDHQASSLDEDVWHLLPAADLDSPTQLFAAFAAGRRPDLLEILAARLTVGETHFFRVAPQVEALRHVVLPELIGRRAAERRLRLWSAGCSTGEEPYTLAILLRELLPAPEHWDIELLATDISRSALEVARRAVYGEWSFRETPEHVRQRYFTAAGKRWQLVEPLRRMVGFAHLNLAADSFPSPGPSGPDLDLILCRNVTIYFSADATRRLYRRFAEALVPAGWLVLGPSDPSPEPGGALEPVYLPGAVLWRRRAVAREALPAAATDAVREPPRPSSPSRRVPHGPGARRPAPPLAAPPEEAAADLARVRALAHGGERRTAREQAERLARARPLEAEAHLLLGMWYLDEGSPGPARESLRRAAFLDAHNPLAHFGLGRAYLQLGEMVRAQSAFVRARRILATAPDDQPVPGGGELAAGELRRAVEAQLRTLGRATES